MENQVASMEVTVFSPGEVHWPMGSSPSSERKSKKEMRYDIMCKKQAT
jgi:hypothetical protein